MGPAYHNLHRSFIMNFIFITFLLLCTILIQVQIVTICDRLNFYKCFNVVFGTLYCIFHMAYRLYRVARQCHQLHVPKHRRRKTTRRPHQQLMQTLPLLDKCIPDLKTRPFTLHRTYSLAYTTNTPKNTSSSTGQSGRRTQNRNISRTVDIHRRPILHQRYSWMSGSTIIRYHTQRKFTVMG